MKVLVNFGSVRCIVPVGDGHISVGQLTDLAIDRYRKATNTSSNSSVVVHNLKTCRDGAILDPDDTLSDVADDREQIIASFEIRNQNCSQELSPKLKNGLHSDRNSTSTASDSLGTGSPDVFINEDKVLCNRINDNNTNEIVVEDMNRKNMPNITIDYSDYNDVEITSAQINSCVCVPLQVRRGSEPVLNRVSPTDHDVCDPTKRWSTAVAIDCKNKSYNRNNSSTHSLDINSEHSDEDKDKSLLSSNSLSPPSIREEGYGSEEKSEHTPSSTTSNTFSRFSRGSGRLSMIANNLDVWAEAADRQLTKSIKDKNKNYNSLPKHLNYDFVGKTSVSSMSSEDNTKHQNIEDRPPSVIVNLAKESGPLGIHVVPESDDIEYGNGLLIQGIEPGGRIDRDGRLHVGDSIIEINGQTIIDVDFESAQQIFRNALQSEEISLKLIKYNQNEKQNLCSTGVKKPFPPPVLPKPANVMKQHEQLRLVEGMVEGEERAVQPTKVATVTSTKKLTPTVTPNTHKPTVSTALVVANTRKIGKKYHIQLKKSNEGLGFSITTRDNPTGGNCPIYIKNVLPKGAAVEDGRLRPGDRLLEVCGIEMTGKPQTEAVKILRTIPLGTTVDLIVSRQELDLSPSPMMPRPMPAEKSGETVATTGNEREVLTFEIPLNDTGSAGLGVSVKGKTSTSSGQHSDLGIFVKSVIHGGAASKDGRLKTNDQLININGIPLLGMSNSQAMETLRRAMIQSEGPIANPNAITLTVARKSIQSTQQLNNSCHQRNDSLLSATSNDSCIEDSLTTTQDMSFTTNSNKLDDTYDSYRSNDNTVIYRPKTSEQMINRDRDESQSVSSSSQPTVVESSPPTPSSANNPVINQSSNQTFLKQFYLSENHDSNRVYNKSNSVVSRSDVMIERDTNAREGGSDQRTGDSAPESTPRDSQLSLNDENDEGFRRDGFGRQSMSEKRHAQLDAKSTDTYRRNKKAKEEKDRQTKDRTEHQSPERRDQSVNEIQQQNSETQNIIPHELVPNTRIVNQRSTSVESLTVTTCPSNSITIKVTNYERKCRSPGSCPYHSTTQTKNNQNNNKDMGPALGMRKSSSLESLQTLMQDLQKEQLDSVNAFNGPRHATVRVSRSRETNESFRAAVDRSYDANNDTENHETMETVAEEGSDSGSSVENIHHQTHAIPVRGPSGALSMTSTQCTATTATTTEDEAQGFLKKKNSGKKKGLFKTLFKFGSKKGRSSSSKQKSDREPVGEQLIEHTSAQNAQQMYILEQERIQMHYKRLIEQQQHLQQQQSAHVSQTAQPTPPARQRSKSAIGERFGGVQPMHSTPTGVTTGQLSTHGLTNDQVMSRNERMAQLRAQHQRMHVERHRVYPNEHQIYDTYSSIDRKHQLDNNTNVYSPNYCTQMYIRYPINANYTTAPVRRLVLPKIDPQYNEHNIRNVYHIPNAFQRRTSSLRCSANNPKIPSADLHHSRGNSYDIYRQAMERPGSRVGIADHNSKYSHYMNYREIQQQMHQYQQQQTSAANQIYGHSRGVYGSPVNVVNAGHSGADHSPVRHVLRGQHQRQVSSPVSHNSRERPNSNYYEYESVNASVPMKGSTLLNPQQQLIQQQNNSVNNSREQTDNYSSASLTRRSKKYRKPEQIPQQTTGASIQVPIARQQQPIYQSNQLKIYGSTTYSNGYSGQPKPPPPTNPPPIPIYETFQGNSSVVNANTGNNGSTNGYHNNTSKYQSLRPGSKV